MSSQIGSNSFSFKLGKPSSSSPSSEGEGAGAGDGDGEYVLAFGLGLGLGGIPGHVPSQQVADDGVHVGSHLGLGSDDCRFPPP